MLILPKPALGTPATSLVCVARALVDVGTGMIVRLKMLVNSMRTLNVFLESPPPILKVRPMFMFSIGRR